MANMMNYLTSSIFEERLRKHCIKLKYYYVSGINEMGEGEMKIFDLIT